LPFPLDIEALASVLLAPATTGSAARILGTVMPPDEDAAAWKRDFDRLFLVPSDDLVFLRESWWRSAPDGPSRGVRPDPDCLGDLSAIYRAFEFVVPERFSSLPDHLGVELIFLHCLVGEADKARTAGDLDLEERLREWADRFERQHIQGILAAVGRRIRERATTALYRQVGALLEEMSSRETDGTP